MKGEHAHESRTRPQEAEIVDVEEYGKEGREPPEAKGYRIRIDKQTFVVEVPQMSGRQLLELAGERPAEQYAIYQKLHGVGQPQKIGYEEVVSFRKPGLERFVTLPLDQTEGLNNTRRQFKLLPEDEEFLEALGLSWETVTEGPVRGVVVHGRAIPEGYKETEVSMHVRLDSCYPDVQIDMAYFHPALQRGDGRPLRAVSLVNFDGRSWQQWSRHRTRQNPWRPGVDNLSTHFALADEWLVQELRKP